MQSLNHAIQLLDVLRRQPKGMGPTELSVALKLSKASTFRILNTLVESRYVIKDPATGKYRLWVMLWQLGCAAADQGVSLREATEQVLRQLAERSGETANLTVYDRGRVVYIDSVESPQALKIILKIGESAPAYCVASGKVLLANQPPAEVEAVIRAGLKAYTPKTIVSPTELRRELTAIRTAGVARNLGEHRPGVGGVAVPILDAGGRAIAALSIAGPLMRLSGSNIRVYEKMLREAAADVMRRINGARQLRGIDAAAAKRNEANARTVAAGAGRPRGRQ